MRRVLITALAATAALVFAGPASAATLDPTSMTVTCSPESVATGSATTCKATVTDTASAPISVPAGQVAFSAMPGSGDFATCTLEGGAAGAVSAACSVSFTPGSGGSYVLTGKYPGDASHDGSSASDAPSAVDPTQTALSCSSSTVSVGTAVTCTATLSDATGSQQPGGEVTFSSAPAANTAFNHAGLCTWTPSGGGGSGTCTVQFTPEAAGSYTLTAAYGGDDSHQASQGTFGVTATTTPPNGPPASHPGTPGSVTIPVTSSPPPGTLKIAGQAKVRGRIAGVVLSCTGATSSHCRGAMVLVTKVKKRVKVVIRSKAKRKGKGKRARRRTRFKKITVTLPLGSLNYDLLAGRTQTFSVKLSKKAGKLVIRAGKRGLRATAIALGPVTAKVTLVSAHPKKKHHKHHKHKKHKRKKH